MFRTSKLLTTVMGGGWNPSKSIGGATPALWLRADDLAGADGDAITTWTSREGNAYAFTQTTAEKKPLLKLTTNGIGGQPCVRFDGSNDILVCATTISTSLVGTLIIVYRLSASPSDNQTLLCTSDEDSIIRLLQIGGYYSSTYKNIKIYQDDPVTAADTLAGDTVLVAATAYLFVLTGNGSAYTARVNGAAQTLTAVTGTNSGEWFGTIDNRDNVTIGGVKYTSEVAFTKGDIAEVILYNAVLTAPQIVQVEAYLANRYGPFDRLPQLQQDYIDMEFGALIHFNMATFGVPDIASANQAVDTFAPTDLDIDQWLDACVSAGMTYATLTTKHVDGFALWPTEFTVGENAPYSIGSTAWYAANGSPDIVGLFVAGCNSRGLKPCLYFGIEDTTYEVRSGTDETSDAAAYIAMIETQLGELLTSYGNITAIWTDAWKWHMGYEEIPYATIRDYIKTLQPNCLLVENNHEHTLTNTEIAVYETIVEGAIPAGNILAAEEVNTARVNEHWFFHAADEQDDDDYIAAATIAAAIANANTNHATYTLGIMPGTDGHLPAALVTRLAQIPSA